jgi:nitrogen fixation-related uncharacterized protein
MTWLDGLLVGVVLALLVLLAFWWATGGEK